MGRPPKLEAWRVERYLRALATLAPTRVCAAYAGVDRRTVQRWVERGRRDRERRANEGDEAAPPSPYDRFVSEYERIECEAELRMPGPIALAGETQWTAMAWLLERRRPEDYRRRIVRVVEADGAPQLDTEELARAIAQAQAEVGASIPKPRGWDR